MLKVWILVLLGICCVNLSLTWAQNQPNQEEETEYYEYEYEEEEAQVEVGVTNQGFVEPEVKIPERKRGFLKREIDHFALKLKPLVNKQFLNSTAEQFNCVPRVIASVAAQGNYTGPRPNISDFNSMSPLEKLRILTDIADGKIEMDTLSSIMQETSSNATAASSSSQASSSQPKKRVSFREIQEEKKKARLEAKKIREAAKPKFPLGADCETLVCGSCKAIVEEFGSFVYKAVDDSSIEYIDQLVTNLCDRKEIYSRYDDIVVSLCARFQSAEFGYGSKLAAVFESDPNYDTIKNFNTLKAKKEEVCTAVGACTMQDFEFVTRPLTKFQDHWDDKCYVCQAFAKDVEERVQLTRYVTEGNIVPIVRDSCDRLSLSPEYDEICRTLSTGKMLDDISWIAKVHDEAVQRNQKAELRFPDKLCEEIKYCTKWVDPDEKLLEEEEEAMDEVFF